MNPRLVVADRGRISRSTAGAALIALVWLVYGVATLSQHGLTLDETSCFYAGDRTLFFLTHPSVPGALAFEAPGEPPGLETRFPRWPDFSDPMHYPVFQHLVMAVTNSVFHVRLGWVDDIDGHHLGIVVLHALGLFLFALYAVKLLGTRAGLAAAVLYGLTPTIVGFGFNNPKDLVETDFYGAALLAAAAAFLHGRPRDLWAAAILNGLGLSCKINAAFVDVTVLLWLPFARQHFAEFRARGLLKPLLWAPVLAFGIFFALWPWLWYGSPLDWVRHLAGYAQHVLSFSHSARATPTLFPFVALVVTTPPLDLLLMVVGAGALFSRSHAAYRVRWLIAIWVALPLLRTALPYSEFYDGNRHFMEYIPGACVLMGIGAGFVLERLEQVSRGKLVAGTAAALGIYVLTLPIRAYRPYEGAYFSELFGGLGWAQRVAVFFMEAPPHDSRSSGSEGDFWDSNLHEALQTINALSSPGDTQVGFCGPSPINIDATLTSPARFRLTRWNDPSADYVYILARECYCQRSDLRQLETERPVIARVERGGGLIYEILGPRVPYELPPVSPHSYYEDLPHYR